MGYVDPTRERFRAFMETSEDYAPVVMINLLRYRALAAYPNEFDASPCSGRAAYERYVSVATQRIASVGGRVLWMGQVQFMLIAPDDEKWDDALVVEYPSRHAFREMLAQPEYRAAVPHRTAALEDSRLIATRTRTNFSTS